MGNTAICLPTLGYLYHAERFSGPYQISMAINRPIFWAFDHAQDAWHRRCSYVCENEAGWAGFIN